MYRGDVQVMWLLYLIALEVYPFPLMAFNTRIVKDWFGNSLELPVLSSLNLYSSLAVLVRNLTILWIENFPAATDPAGSETLPADCTVRPGWWNRVLQVGYSKSCHL